MSISRPKLLNIVESKLKKSNNIISDIGKASWSKKLTVTNDDEKVSNRRLDDNFFNYMPFINNPFQSSTGLTFICETNDCQILVSKKNFKEGIHQFEINLEYGLKEVSLGALLVNDTDNSINSEFLEKLKGQFKRKKIIIILNLEWGFVIIKIDGSKHFKKIKFNLNMIDTDKSFKIGLKINSGNMINFSPVIKSNITNLRLISKFLTYDADSLSLKFNDTISLNLNQDIYIHLLKFKNNIEFPNIKYNKDMLDSLSKNYNEIEKKFKEFNYLECGEIFKFLDSQLKNNEDSNQENISIFKIPNSKNVILKFKNKLKLVREDTEISPYIFLDQRNGNPVINLEFDEIKFLFNKLKIISKTKKHYIIDLLFKDLYDKLIDSFKNNMIYNNKIYFEVNITNIELIINYIEYEINKENYNFKDDKVELNIYENNLNYLNLNKLFEEEEENINKNIIDQDIELIDFDITNLKYILKVFNKIYEYSMIKSNKITNNMLNPFNRLKTLINIEFEDIFLLAQKGFYIDNEILGTVKNISNPNIYFNLNKKLDLKEFIKKNKIKNYNYLNMNTCLSLMPSYTLSQDYEIIVDDFESYFYLFNKNNLKLNILSCKYFIVDLMELDLNDINLKQNDLEVKKEQVNSNFLINDYSFDSEILDLDEVNDEEIFIKADIIDGLYNMGFPINQIKKNLKGKKVKNMENAVQILLESENVKELENVQIVEEKKGILKNEWICECCTVINDKSNINQSLEPGFCYLCVSPAPISAYTKVNNIKMSNKVEEIKINPDKYLLDKEHLESLKNKIFKISFENNLEENLTSVKLLRIKYMNNNKLVEIKFEINFNKIFLNKIICHNSKENLIHFWIGNSIINNDNYSTEISGKYKEYYNVLDNIYPYFYENDKIFEISQVKIFSKEISEGKILDYFSTFNHTIIKLLSTNNLINILILDKSLQNIKIINLEVDKINKIFNIDDILIIHINQNKFIIISQNELEKIEDKLYIEDIKISNLNYEYQQVKLKKLKQIENDNFIISKINHNYFIKLMNQLFKLNLNILNYENLVKFGNNKDLNKCYKFHSLNTKDKLINIELENNKNYIIKIKLNCRTYNKEYKKNLNKKYINNNLNNLFESVKDEKYLPLKLFYFEGDSMNSNMYISKIFENNNEMFCTLNENSLFVFENLFERIMRVNFLTIGSNLKSNINSNPIKEGIVFGLNNINFISKIKNITKKIHNIKQYVEFLEKKNNIIENDFEPLIYFDLKNEERITFELKTKMKCKYLCLIPTSFRNSQYNNSQSNCSINFFGIFGLYIYEKNVLYLEEFEKKTIGNLNTDSPLFELIYPNKTEVYNKYNINKIYENSKNNKDFRFDLNLEIPIDTGSINNLKLKFKDNESYEIENINLNIFSEGNQSIMDIKKKFKDNNAEFIIKFIKDLVISLENTDNNLESFINIINFIIIKLKHDILNYFIEFVDFENFIKKYVLILNNNKNQNLFINLIVEYNNYTDKTKNIIYNSIKNLILNIESWKITNLGIKFLFQLFKSIIKKNIYNNDDLRNESILKLYNKNIKNIWSLIDENHLVALNNNIIYFPNDNFNYFQENSELTKLYSEVNLIQKNENLNLNYINFEYFSKKFTNSISFYFDLYQIYEVKEIQIFFKGLKPLIKTKIDNITFYDENGNKNESIHKIFDEHINYQLSKMTKNTTNYEYYLDLKLDSKFSPIGININNIKAKYIKIEIAYSLIPSIKLSKIGNQVEYDFKIIGDMVKSEIDYIKPSEYLLLNNNKNIQKILKSSNNSNQMKKLDTNFDILIVQNKEIKKEINSLLKLDKKGEEFKKNLIKKINQLENKDLFEYLENFNGELNLYKNLSFQINLNNEISKFLIEEYSNKKSKVSNQFDLLDIIDLSLKYFNLNKYYLNLSTLIQILLKNKTDEEKENLLKLLLDKYINKNNISKINYNNLLSVVIELKAYFNINNWTYIIEYIYNYLIKKFDPRDKNFKFKFLFWIEIIKREFKHNNFDNFEVKDNLNEEKIEKIIHILIWLFKNSIDSYLIKNLLDILSEIIKLTNKSSGSNFIFEKNSLENIIYYSINTNNLIYIEKILTNYINIDNNNKFLDNNKYIDNLNIIKDLIFEIIIQIMKKKNKNCDNKKLNYIIKDEDFEKIKYFDIIYTLLNISIKCEIFLNKNCKGESEIKLEKKFSILNEEDIINTSIKLNNIGHKENILNEIISYLIDDINIYKNINLIKILIHFIFKDNFENEFIMKLFNKLLEYRNTINLSMSLNYVYKKIEENYKKMNENQIKLNNIILTELVIYLKNKINNENINTILLIMKNIINLIFQKNYNANNLKDFFYEPKIFNSSIKLVSFGKLFILYSDILYNNCNFNGEEGFNCLSRVDIEQLELEDALGNYLFYNKPNDEDYLLNYLFYNSRSIMDTLDHAYNNIIKWYLINKNEAELTSNTVISIYLKKINIKIEHLWELSFKQNDISKLIIKISKNNFEYFNNILNKNILNENLGKFGISMKNNLFKSFEFLSSNFMTSKDLCEYFIKEEKGLTFLLNNIINPDNTKKLNNKSDKNLNILDYINNNLQPNEKNIDKEEIIDLINLENGIFNFKNNISQKISFVKEEGQVLNTQNISNIKHFNKNYNINSTNSSKILLFSVQMINKYYYEIPLKFNLNDVYDLRDIKIGFSNFPNDKHNKLIITPNEVELIIKNNNDYFNYGKLQSIDDPFFSNWNIKVFSINFSNIINLCKDVIKSPNKATEVIFIVKRPTINFIEGKYFTGNIAFNPVEIGVSFVNINGVKTIDVKNINYIIQNKYMIDLVSILFNKKFDNSILEIAQTENFQKLLKKSFLTILKINPKCIQKILITLRNGNNNLIDDILEEFLDNHQYLENFELISLIITANEKYYFKRLKKLFDKIININILNEKLYKFVDVFNCSLWKRKEFISEEVMEFNINKDIILVLLNLIDLKENDYKSNIESFIINLSIISNINKSIKSKEKDLNIYLYNYIKNYITENKNYNFSNLLSLIIIGDSRIFNSVECKEFCVSIVKNLLTYLKKSEEKVTYDINNNLLFLRNISKIKLFSIMLTEYETDIILLNYIRNIKKNYLIKDDMIIKLSLQIIYNILDENPERIGVINDSLISDVKNISNLNLEFNSYIKKIFSPLINYESKLEISISNPDNFEINKNIKIKEIQPQKIKSNIVSDEMIEELTDNLDTLIDSNLRHKFTKGVWKKACESTKDGENISAELEKNLFGKGPFIILIDGKSGTGSAKMGIFSSLPFEKIDPSKPKDEYKISNNQNNFIFFFEDHGNNNNYYYKLYNIDSDDNNFLMYKNNKNTYKSLKLFHDNNEKINISFSTSIKSHIDLYPLKNILSNNEASFEFPFDFTLGSIEFHYLEKNEEIFDENLNINLLNNNDFNTNNSSFYRYDKIYNFNSNLSFKDCENLISKVVKDKVKLNISFPYDIDTNLPLKDVKNKLIENNIIHPPYILDIHCNLKMNYNKLSNDLKKPLLSQFLLKGGLKTILNTLLLKIKNNSIKLKNKDIWFLIISEISIFSKIKGLIEVIISNSVIFNTIMNLFSKNEEFENEENEEEIILIIYNSFMKHLEVNYSLDLVQSIKKNEILYYLIKRISIISSETGRKYFTDKELTEKDEKEQKKQEITQVKNTKLEKEVKKRKGVGYGGNSSNKWSTKEYYNKKKKINDFWVKVFKIIIKLLSKKDLINEYKDNQLYHDLSCSGMICFIENCLRNNSLQEIIKEKELYHEIINILSLFLDYDNLKPLFNKLPVNYQPKQISSLYKLISNMKNSAEIFINMVNKDKLEDNEKTEKNIYELSILIVNLYDKINKQNLNFNDDLNIDLDTLDDLKNRKLPINKAYSLLLKDLRFKTCELNVNDHFYKSSIKACQNINKDKIIRIAQEIAELTNALPIEYTNAIFLRNDRERCDVFKVIIFGAEGTPYAHGAFEYHIFCDNDYPSGPPKCNLETTGSGDVRFNPNLYHCGKVCLSLLGTWRGSSNENWNPEISNILQLVISIQAVVMSEEVYFNEPGYENEIGLPEGEKKNEGYSNIVRVNNIKYAMINMIKTPPKGFEDVIRRHFWIKRDLILKEVNKWVQYAEKREALYNGLVHDHNSKYCIKYQKSDEYLKDLKFNITELEKLLNGLNIDIEKIFSTKQNNSSIIKKIKNKNEKADYNKGNLKIDDVDVKYDNNDNLDKKELNADNKIVKDRWSRYIGVMGIESIKKQQEASVIILGLDSLGIEISKNIVLSGVKRFDIFDPVIVENNNRIGQFYLEEDDIGKRRDEASLNKLRSLNLYVNIDFIKNIDQLHSKINEYDIIIICNQNPILNKIIIDKCKNKIILAESRGVFTKIFVDFKEFIVTEKNDMEINQLFIKNIDIENKKISLIDGSKHNFDNGDFIEIDDYIINENNEKIKGTNSILKIKEVINIKSFIIEEFNECIEKYDSEGTVKLSKQPFKINFKNYTEAIKELKIDDNLGMHDFCKFENSNFMHLIFLTFDEYFEKYKACPNKFNNQDLKNYLEISSKIYEIFFKNKFDIYNSDEEESKKNDFSKYNKIFLKLTSLFINHYNDVVPPLNAYIGGIISQEAIKAITHKFTPINQFFYTDIVEIVSKEYSELSIPYDTDIENKIDDYYTPLRNIIGNKLMEKLFDSNIFIIGSGAIGCELIKNIAMMGVSKQGKITITDPDNIELSNLSRQFLFREKHIRDSKSKIASAVILKMNKDLKNHIDARLDRVGKNTEDLYNDDFFEKQTIILNALDNIEARKYVDSRCVTNLKPLIESGTLGPQGHVQVIIPKRTENYGSMQDPKEEEKIPHCTLKMFPEETLHCIEWAKDKFENYFGQKILGLDKVLSYLKDNKNLWEVEFKILKDSLKLMKKIPKSYDDCINIAVNKFHKYYNLDIEQLLHAYPIDHKTKEGKPFWSLPKRPPIPLVIENNEIIVNFIWSFSNLLSIVYNIEIENKEFRSDSFKELILKKALKIDLEKFIPSDNKIKEMKKEALKAENKKVDEKEEEEEEEEKEEEEENQDDNNIDTTIDEIKLIYELKKGQILKSLVSQEFEKDDDSNFHIDFIHSAGNLRAMNYKLKIMDFVNVKLKAGKIIPALATTTSAIAGLQSIELIKVINENEELEDFKNAFLNMAVPILQLTEPGPYTKHKIHDNLTINVWDRWEIKNCSEKTFKEVYEELKNTYNLEPRDCFYEATCIIMGGDLNKEIFDKKISDVLPISKEDKLELIITFSLLDSKEILKDIPKIICYY